MAARFWVGGTGTWDASTTTNWSATSGGAGGQSVPGVADTVTFDGSSGGGTVTCGAAYNPSVVSITFGAFTGTLDFNTNTNSVTVRTISGSWAWARTFNMGAGTWTVTWNAATIIDFTTVTSLTVANPGTFACNYSGATGTRTIAPSIALAEASTFSINVTAGTDTVAFTSTGRMKNLNWTGFAGTNTAVGIILYGNLTFAAGMTVTVGSATISFSGTSGVQTVTSNGCVIWRGLVFSGTGSLVRFADSMTNNLPSANGTVLNLTTSATQSVDFTTNSVTVTLTGLNPSVTWSFVGNNAFYNLSIVGTTTTTGYFQVNNDLECTNNISITGNSATTRIIVASGTGKGSKRKITAAGMGANHGSGVDFQDIIGAGAATWDMSAAANYSGDAGGNSMKALGAAAFTTAATQTATGTASFSWSTHGWTSRVPLPQDDVVINNAFVAGRTVTVDMPRIGKSVSVNPTGNPTFTISASCSLFWSLLLTGVTHSNGQVLSFEGRAANTINLVGTFENWVTVNAPNGSLTMAANLTIGTTRSVTATLGTFDTGGYVLSTGNISLGTGANGYIAKLKLNAETHLLTASLTTIIDFSSTLKTSVLDAGTSTLKLTSTANNSTTVANAKKLYNIWFDRGTSTWAINITLSWLYNDFKSTPTVANTINFTAGTVQGVVTFTVVGSSGKLITLQSGTGGSKATLLCKTGTISCDYVTSKDLLVGGGATWNAGVNSTFSTGNYFCNSYGWADAPDTVRSRYFVGGGTGNFNSTTNWSTTTGGASGASVPIGEIVKLDANSWSNTLTVNAASSCGRLDCTGFTGSLVASGFALTLSGSLKLVSGMAATLTVANALTFAASGTSKTLDFGTKTYGSASIGFTGVNALSSNLLGDEWYGDTWTLASNTVLPLGCTVTLNSGTLASSTYDFTMGKFASSNSNNRTVNLGSGTWELTSTANVWDTSNSLGLTVVPWTSTIKASDPSNNTNSKTFNWGGMAYNNLWISGYSTGVQTFTGSNSFNELKFDNFVPRSVSFAPGTFTKFNTLTASGSSGNILTFTSTTAFEPFYLKPSTGWASIDYVSMGDCYCMGTLFIGTNSISTNASGVAANNTNVLATAPTSRIAGAVTNGGTGVANALVRVCRADDDRVIGSQLTNGSWNYSFYADPAKQYHVFVEYTNGGTKYNAKSLWYVTPA